MYKGIGYHQQEEIRKTGLRLSKSVRNWFLLTCCCIFLVYIPFKYEWIHSKPRYSTDLTIPIALVRTPFGTGTAFLVGQTRLLTANHVLARLKIGDEVELMFEKSEPIIQTKARIIFKGDTSGNSATNLENDFAVLELTTPNVIPSDFPRLILTETPAGIRDNVVLIGYPLGLYSVTEGTISNDKIKNYEIYQLDVGAWEGNSGGPLINANTNEVIGILVAGFEGEFKGINMACKMNKILPSLRRGKVDWNR